MPQSVSILGCGWLGLPLARTLLNAGYQVKGSTTSAEKIPELKKAGIEPFLLECLPHPAGENISDFFKADVLVITIPFKRDLPDPQFYARQIEGVLMQAQKISRLIFTSSTAVYPDDLAPATEDARFVPDNPRAKVLYDLEQKLLKHQAAIVRFGGLYGKDRKIGKFLAGKKDLIDGAQPVNLIHQEDSVNILKGIIEQDLRRLFYAVSDEHPTRKELYTKAAAALGLPAPQFKEEQPKKNYKIVSNAKIKTSLNYRFIHPDLLKDI